MPEYFRQGVGTALIQKAVAALKEQQHQSMCLWVLDKNKRGCNFYEAMGGQRVGKKMIEIGPTKAKEVCYGWRDIDVILKH
jgi:ribosomal protein S18 acetylase RimI-like enzyme